MAWEHVTLELARAGVEVSRSRTEKIGGRTVLIVTRFDRAGGTRIGYASALTMLEAKDGEIGSYLDIALVVDQFSDRPTADLHQLWRRIAFGVLVSNTDDHLRNHAFLHGNGDIWRLSPAFDLNPDPSPGPHHLATAIDETDTRADIDTLMRVAPQFRLGPDQARAILREVVDAVGRWRDVAGRAGVSTRDAGRMAPAFEHAAAQRARDLATPG